MGRCQAMSATVAAMMKNRVLRPGNSASPDIVW